MVKRGPGHPSGGVGKPTGTLCKKLPNRPDKFCGPNEGGRACPVAMLGGHPFPISLDPRREVVMENGRGFVRRLKLLDGVQTTLDDQN